ncbi:MAG: C40 family peptidase [Bdellovibrionales bacterium]
MSPENKKIFFDYALSQMPNEACGVIVIEKGRERLVVCKNKSIFNDQFSMDSADYAKASLMGEVIGIVHSHVNLASTPSEADKVSCEATGLEWFICSVPNGAWSEFKPSGYEAPLIGRTWAHGVLDCYSLVRDLYKKELKIDLIDFDREVEFWEKGFDLYCDENFKKAGFVDVPFSDLRKYDGILMKIKSKVINHAGVYLGDDKFIHHLMRRLSSRDVFAGYYRKHTVKIVRHECMF